MSCSASYLRIKRLDSAIVNLASLLGDYLAEKSPSTCNTSLSQTSRDYLQSLLKSLEAPAGEAGHFSILKQEVQGILAERRCVTEVSGFNDEDLPLVLSSEPEAPQPGLTFFGTGLPRADSAAAYSPLDQKIHLTFPDTERLKKDPNYRLGLGCALKHELRHHNGGGEFLAYRESAGCDPYWQQYFKQMGSGDLDRGILGGIMEASNYQVRDYSRAVMEYADALPEKDRLIIVSNLLPGGMDYYGMLAQFGAHPQKPGELTEYRLSWVQPPVGQVQEGISQYFAARIA